VKRFPVGRDRSDDGSASFHLARTAGFALKIALGAVVMRAPAVTDLDQDPLSVIETGDWVKADVDRDVVDCEEDI
jgi:hypothetical protein